MQPHHILPMLCHARIYNGEWIKACGWYPDYVWRLFNKTFTRFNDNIIHESVMLPKNAKLIKLKVDRSIMPLGTFHICLINFSVTQAYGQSSTASNAQVHLAKTTSYTRAMDFCKKLSFQKGILYGYKGFAISVCNGLGAFFKYLKLYELGQTPPTCSLIITTYNQKERLALVLNSVKNLAFLPNEVLIADDGSLKDKKS